MVYFILVYYRYINFYLFYGIIIVRLGSALGKYISALNIKMVMALPIYILVVRVEKRFQ